MSNLSVFNQFAPKAIDNTQLAKNAVIYTRVSHSSQEDNTSLEAQRKRCEEYASANGYSVIQYFGGTHESAKTDDRKEFNRMLTFVKRNKRVNFILVYSYERFSRTGADGMKIAQDLQKQYKVTTLSVSQGIDPSTITGEFQRNIMLLFGHLDNQMRKDKTVSGMRELVEKGYTPYSIPKGYVNLNKGSKAVDQKIVLNEEGKLLRKAFIWKADNQMRNCEILVRLNALGLKLNDRRISEILSNPYYCGIIVSKLSPNKAIEGKHEPMISREIFLKVNNVVADNRMHPVSHKSEDENLPLKRFSRCSECGTPLTGFIVRKKNLWYYKCRTIGCKTSKGAKQLHEQFKTVVSEYRISEEQTELIKMGIGVMYSVLFEEHQENQKMYNAKISELKNKIESAEEKLVTGVIDRPMFDKFQKKFSDEMFEVENLLAKIKSGNSNLEKGLKLVVKYCQNPLLWWENASIGQRMIFQNILFPEGIIYDRKNDRFQTPRTNTYFEPIPHLTDVLQGKKNGDSINFDAIPACVTSSGFKPETSTAVMWCSIQLSYEAFSTSEALCGRCFLRSTYR
jgi:site-specific DNA recombinase